MALPAKVSTLGMRGRCHHSTIVVSADLVYERSHFRTLVVLDVQQVAQPRMRWQVVWTGTFMAGTAGAYRRVEYTF